ncbi:serine/threonine-protein phosphatase 6 regulatory ankyrin repeat subunit A [Aplysia californica]|uniref:Serine/threonine-protein phosphatase 6 regulatory ankyrin repeat subunit A n=1 Tax=Aplysia californica TaxID=6500 RepID=A0ABM0ZYN5_APLCA|nr:serine/threonine-protein phosphatase 6 regulatory ankyrin repeat subunit A [Aplysia californica]
MESGDLYFAVAENKPDRLNELLEQGGNVDEFYDDMMNISSKSLLHVCCGKGHIDCLKVLIAHGAQLDVRDKWGQTPLMYSATIQFTEIAQTLLEADSELVQGQDRFGKSPLHCAVDVGSWELARLLLLHGADVNLRCHDGLSPLMYCCTADPEGKRRDVMRLLLDEGAVIDLKDYRGKRSALHLSVVSGNVEAVQRLVSAGASINEMDKTLRTPLTHALYSGVRGSEVSEAYSSIISLLVSAGADLNMATTEGCNPLLSSALLKSETMVRYFLSLGADPDVKFHSGVTPALVSASTGDLATLKALIFYNCDLKIKGNVYKKRRQIEYVIDPFELAYMEGFLRLCVLMTRSGYRVHDKAQIFEDDAFRTAPADWKPTPVLSRLAPQEAEQERLTLSKAQHLPEDFRDCLRCLVEMSRSPRALRELATLTVRMCMKNRLVAGVERLPVPRAVKNSILFNDLLT